MLAVALLSGYLNWRVKIVGSQNFSDIHKIPNIKLGIPQIQVLATQWMGSKASKKNSARNETGSTFKVTI